MKETLAAVAGGRKPRRKALVALRVVNEKALDKRLMQGRVGRMEGVTVLNPGAAMLGRMRTRQVVKAKNGSRAQPKGK